ncbi:Hint domain-containing protein [Oceaniglobus ichthyenteri]|uniref:Hint domain-containing protein n=1 Tax=Oceaniglobus ichthyenteri TaxID=2136177 RepID=UPI000D3A2A14|nr:Hint domain-containing protein [Oceaniglobus ichthyenteri]
MTNEVTITTEPAQSVAVYRSSAFCAIDGANLGDPLSHADELNLGDVYMLAPQSKRPRLALTPTPTPGRMAIAADTECGWVGAALHLDSCATFMTPDGSTVEALILVELNSDNASVAEIYLFPLARLKPKIGYSLVALDKASALARFAEIACVSFTRGTRITLASGRQIAIERIGVGDAVLTRDHGPQKVRWIGQQTVRATGALAPIRITAGTLNNDNDLLVSPNHRLFIYQRHDHMKAGRAEVLVKAKHLVNDETVLRTDGGFVDYFQILFDRHEIIYAEGIAAESLMVNTRVRAALPRDVQDTVAGGGAPLGVELGRAKQGTDTATLLRAASSR